MFGRRALAIGILLLLVLPAAVGLAVRQTSSPAPWLDEDWESGSDGWGLSGGASVGCNNDTHGCALVLPGLGDAQAHAWVAVPLGASSRLTADFRIGQPGAFVNTGIAVVNLDIGDYSIYVLGKRNEVKFAFNTLGGGGGESKPFYPKAGAWYGVEVVSEDDTVRATVRDASGVPVVSFGPYAMDAIPYTTFVYVGASAAADPVASADAWDNIHLASLAVAAPTDPPPVRPDRVPTPAQSVDEDWETGADGWDVNGASFACDAASTHGCAVDLGGDAGSGFVRKDVVIPLAARYSVTAAFRIAQQNVPVTSYIRVRSADGDAVAFYIQDSERVALEADHGRLVGSQYYYFQPGVWYTLEILSEPGGISATVSDAQGIVLGFSDATTSSMTSTSLVEIGADGHTSGADHQWDDIHVGTRA